MEETSKCLFMSLNVPKVPLPKGLCRWVRRQSSAPAVNVRLKKSCPAAPLNLKAAAGTRMVTPPATVPKTHPKADFKQLNGRRFQSLLFGMRTRFFLHALRVFTNLTNLGKIL